MRSQGNATHSPTSVQTKGMRRRLRILIFFLIGFLLWAGLTIMDQLQLIEQQSSKLLNLEQEHADAQKLNQQYKNEIIRLNDPEYIEQRLRKDLHMTKEGEILFIPVE